MATTIAPQRTTSARVRRTSRIGQLGRWTFIAIAVITQVTPFYLALTTAFKPITDTTSLWLPPLSGGTLDNFSTAWNSGHLEWALENGLIVTVVSTALTCIVGAMAAYPLARRSTKLNRFVSLLILGMLMVPPLSILVPLYTMLAQLGLLNTYISLSLVLTTIQLPLAVFLFTQFMRTLPLSLEEAAAIDGAGLTTTFLRIVLPSLKPVIATVVILTSTNVWNEFAMSSYILNQPEVRTLAPAAASFFGSQGNNIGAAAAAALIGLLPILIAYLFLQKYFVKGALAGAEK
ncbi:MULTISPECIES: carbohydrate ABC transporter permease [Arthrobacter]|uniref:Carbohydrate ABC transporter permease n=1 Tax=Arthrobacter terricola TaxID=2547396 RepID=A0A4R5KF78_9MICC|nr:MULTISPECIES: carbohydrate ABC transporter permease [Arthrobacter]MBT8159655.1 carbohydrate ABC transporter permease [Arthrobacter sp. GN70]TDF93612.1 carbohydrate ABC transporter permease [Arthrobacter terricola]